MSLNAKICISTTLSFKVCWLTKILSVSMVCNLDPRYSRNMWAIVLCGISRMKQCISIRAIAIIPQAGLLSPLAQGHSHVSVCNVCELQHSQCPVAVAFRSACSHWCSAVFCQAQLDLFTVPDQGRFWLDWKQLNIALSPNTSQIAFKIVSNRGAVFQWAILHR